MMVKLQHHRASQDCVILRTLPALPKQSHNLSIDLRMTLCLNPEQGDHPSLAPLAYRPGPAVQA